MLNLQEFGEKPTMRPVTQHTMASLDVVGYLPNRMGRYRDRALSRHYHPRDGDSTVSYHLRSAIWHQSTRMPYPDYTTTPRAAHRPGNMSHPRAQAIPPNAAE